MADEEDHGLEGLGDVSSLTICSLWVQVYSHLGESREVVQGMAVCQTFRRELPKLVTDISVTGEFDQEELEHAARTFPNLKKLFVECEYSDDSPELDFDDVLLPHLQTLNLSCCPVANLRFTKDNTPELKHLSISNSSETREFYLDLPELLSLSLNYVTIEDCSDFGASLSRCPKLEQLTSYKLWGPSDVYSLKLPKCHTLDLYRSDCLGGLKLWAPKLKRLNLQACYDLRCVRLMGKEGPPVQVNLVNACVDKASMRHLLQHPRVGRKRMSMPDDDREGAMFDMLHGPIPFEPDELGAAAGAAAAGGVPGLEDLDLGPDDDDDGEEDSEEGDGDDDDGDDMEDDEDDEGDEDGDEDDDDEAAAARFFAALGGQHMGPGFAEQMMMQQVMGMVHALGPEVAMSLLGDLPLHPNFAGDDDDDDGDGEGDEDDEEGEEESEWEEWDGEEELLGAEGRGSAAVAAGPAGGGGGARTYGSAQHVVIEELHSDPEEDEAK